MMLWWLLLVNSYVEKTHMLGSCISLYPILVYEVLLNHVSIGLDFSQQLKPLKGLLFCYATLPWLKLLNDVVEAFGHSSLTLSLKSCESINVVKTCNLYKIL